MKVKEGFQFDKPQSNHRPVCRRRRCRNAQQTAKPTSRWTWLAAIETAIYQTNLRNMFELFV